MAVRGAGNTTVTYNGSNITAYINEVELASTIAELEASNLASTVMQYTPSIAEYTLTMSGDWSSALDAIFGPDIVTPALRTVVVSFTEGGSTVSYTWTTNGFLTGYSISSSASDKITHSPSLRLSGPPTRAVA